MGCRSDYMEPTELEVKLAKVFAFLDELETGKLKKNAAYSGYDERVYGKSTHKILDQKTAELCSKIKELENISSGTISIYSLELQIWWRDHQEFDRKRLEEESSNAELNKLKEVALSKLTSFEKKLLGLEK